VSYLSEQQPQPDPYEAVRTQMVDEQIAHRGVVDQRVLQAMRDVPRHLFVPGELVPHAYTDGPLQIGSGQTISQPYIVALMTELLRLAPGDRVLEVGVGSGYQTAILAELAVEVIGLERIAELAQTAQARLRSLGYHNVIIHITDGSEGFAETAPYDAILVAAAAPTTPRPLIEQLGEGGRLVLPVGDTLDQMLERLTRRGRAIHRERLTPVRFVPLIGRHGFR
jgi:protein-L-isoaspartate(D-aspartate) O-methyltransferase